LLWRITRVTLDMRFKDAVILLFHSILIINLSGLNEFISKKLSLSALLSPLILALVIAILFLFATHNRLGILYAKEVKLFYWPFSIFLVFGMLASIFESGFQQLLNGLRYYLPSLLIFWVGVLGFSLLLKEYGLTKLIKLLRWIFLLNTIIIVFSYFTGNELIDIGGGDGRFAGLLLNANRAGFSGAMLLVSELYLLGSRSSKLSKFLIPLVLLGIFFTFSRTAFIMTILVAGLFLFEGVLGNKYATISRLGTLFGAAGFGAVLYFFVLNEFIEESILLQSTRIEEFSSFAKGEVTARTTGGRSSLAEAGLERIYEKPIFGHGLHTFMKFDDLGSGVHNQYLLIWGEAGIVALLAYVWYLISLWRGTKRRAGLSNFLVKGLVICLAFYSSTSHNMFGEKTVMLTLSLLTVLILDYNYVRDLRIIRKRN